jgi:hypothetical protein
MLSLFVLQARYRKICTLPPPPHLPVFKRVSAIPEQFFSMLQLRNSPWQQAFLPNG